MGIVSTGQHYCLCVVALVCVFSSADRAAAQAVEELAERVGVRILAEARADDRTRDSAGSQLPYSRMSASAQERARTLVANSSQYRRMPALQYEVNPDIYQFLVNHPDAAISSWRAMGISQLKMWQTEEFEYEACNVDGSEGEADVLWRDGNQCVFIVQGRYKSPLLPNPIEASALVWLRYRFVANAENTVYVNQQIETFIHFPSSTVELIARLASRITDTILDRNVFEVSLYARMMSQAARKEPEWIRELASRMDGIAQQQRIDLVRIARGQTGRASRSLPVSFAEERSPANFSTSGVFNMFEASLQEVNVHVPLIPSESSESNVGASLSNVGRAASQEREAARRSTLQLQ